MGEADFDELTSRVGYCRLAGHAAAHPYAPSAAELHQPFVAERTVRAEHRVDVNVENTREFGRSWKPVAFGQRAVGQRASNVGRDLHGQRLGAATID